MLRPFAHPVVCCWMLLRVVAQSLKPVKLFSQQLPTLLGVVASVSTPLPTRTQRLPTLLAQQCWELFPFAPNFTSKFSEINF